MDVEEEVEEEEEDLSQPLLLPPFRSGGDDECEDPFPNPPFLLLHPILFDRAATTEGSPSASAEHARITDTALAAGGGGGDASGGDVAPRRAVPTRAAAAARHSLRFNLSPRNKCE